MFDITKTEFRRTATALVGAAIFSTAALVAAVGPARAAAPATTDAWKATVESRLTDNLVTVRHSAGLDRHAIATVLVDVDGTGRVTDVQMLRSSGSAGLDKQALRRARTVDFPATPSGKAVHVQMNLIFGRSEAAIARARAELARPAAYASKSVDGSSNSAGQPAPRAGM
ncbi:energy transducer TonB family protein [Sphingomonas quercus]|uniref:Energy transducer TonB n=1 Tax=Sphingomonas quercus TaxID=2842451 RepID=A0ABS6BJ89_9SPHN|nr:energy transducer TonB [Sphingomonas quercus]MBU3078378.1 energy transducer TonB [Sphingomonas quercus]